MILGNKWIFRTKYNLAYYILEEKGQKTVVMAPEEERQRTTTTATEREGVEHDEIIFRFLQNSFFSLS